MDKTKLTLMMLPLVALFVVPQAFALESGNTYFLDDSEFISILIDVDSSGVATFPGRKKGSSAFLPILDWR